MQRRGGGRSEARRAAEPQAGETVGEEADEGGEQQPRLEVERFGDLEPACGDRHSAVIGRRERRARRQGVDRFERVGGAVEAGRMARVAGAGEIGADRRGLGRRRPERAEAVEGAIGRARRLAARLLGGARLGRRRPGAGDDPAQHVDEKAGQRQVRPGRVGGDMEEDDQALAARARR